MTGHQSKQMGNGDLKTDAIESLDPTGFTVGTSDLVNQIDVTYQWVAWKAFPGEMVVGTYIGNGVAAQANHGPRVFAGDRVRPSTWRLMTPCTRSARVVPAANAFTFDGARLPIPSPPSDGWFHRWQQHPSSTGPAPTYTTWPGMRFPERSTSAPTPVTRRRQPEHHGRGVSAGLPDGAVEPRLHELVAHSTAMGPATDTSHFFNATANKADEIQLLQPDGFQVGTAPEVESDQRPFFYAAWGRAAPTAVRMATMSARRTATGVVLEWRTGYEADNLGFHVYRGPDNARVRLTTSLLAGSGLQQSSGIGAGASYSYRWSDETAGARAPDVEYWVEEITLSGARMWHGPVRPAAMSVDTAGADAGGCGAIQRRSRSRRHRLRPPPPDRRPCGKSPGRPLSPAQPHVGGSARSVASGRRRSRWHRPTHCKSSGRLPRTPP